MAFLSSDSPLARVLQEKSRSSLQADRKGPRAFAPRTSRRVTSYKDRPNVNPRGRGTAFPAQTHCGEESLRLEVAGWSSRARQRSPGPNKEAGKEAGNDLRACTASGEILPAARHAGRPSNSAPERRLAPAIYLTEKNTERRNQAD